MSDLLPCPMCGTAAHFFKIDDADQKDFGGQGICCQTEGCVQIGLMFACMDDPKPTLAEKWNRRADVLTNHERIELYDLRDVAELAARATAEQRDSVIDECAAVLDRRINGWRARSSVILNGQTVADELEHHAHAIRALKLQQDAAIPFRPWYEILDELKTNPKLLADIEQAVAASKQSIAQLERERTVTREQLNTPLGAAIESQRSGDGS